MAKECEMCGKGTMKINPRKLLRGNLNPVGKRHSKPNLQKKNIDGEKMTVCTRCIRTMNKVS